MHDVPDLLRLRVHVVLFAEEPMLSGVVDRAVVGAANRLARLRHERGIGAGQILDFFVVQIVEPFLEYLLQEHFLFSYIINKFIIAWRQM